MLLRGSDGVGNQRYWQWISVGCYKQAKVELSQKGAQVIEYQIVATLGPSSDTESIWQAMLEAGVTGFRLNTSHLNLTQLEHWLEQLSAFLASSEPTPPVVVVLDLQGSKWRLGDFPTCTLVEGQQVKLVCTPTADQPYMLPVPHPDFFRAAVVSSGEVVLNDARVRLRVEAVNDDTMTTRVITGHTLSSRKGITYSQSTYRQESLNEQDQAILVQSRGLDFVRYALSYVRDAVEMAKYRAYVGPSAYLIAKIERQPAVDATLPIAEIADEVWLCRGDLGAELGLKAMAETTARFSQQVRDMSVPVLLAGQVLEYMTTHPTPTRSEICHLVDVLQQGYDGVVLSDETAIGNYPVESCQAVALFRAGD